MTLDLKETQKHLQRKKIKHILFSSDEQDISLSAVLRSNHKYDRICIYLSAGSVRFSDACGNDMSLHFVSFVDISKTFLGEELSFHCVNPIHNREEIYKIGIIFS